MQGLRQFASRSRYEGSELLAGKQGPPALLRLSYQMPWKIRKKQKPHWCLPSRDLVGEIRLQKQQEEKASWGELRVE